MPSANPKLEKQASTEAVDPIRQVITVIEHKIRNLEKRKGKLESYKDIQKNGKELDRDQKTAVAKYDEVLQTLDITRDLYKSIQSISNDNAKAQKKLARKEALERTQQDIAKVKEVLLIQDTLINMGTEVAREDFLHGTNGATKLSEEELKTLDDLFNEVTVKRQTEPGEPPFAQQVHKAAEHFVAIVDGKQREVIGTTYIKIKEIVTAINQSGYFDQVHEVETAAQEQSAEASSEARVASGAQAPEQSAEDYSAGEVHIPPPESMIPAPNFPVQVAQLPVVSGPAPVAGPLPVVAQPIPPHPAAPVDASFYVNAAGFVPQSQQQQQQVPPPQQQQQQQQPQQQPPQAQQPPQQPQAPRINDVIGTPDFFFLQESELDSPDVTGQSAPIVSHIPPAVNAPIPSQTFTNQSFAGAPVQVIYQHPPPPQDMPHIPGFANPNPPPPIPMPPSHQQQNLPYSPQHPAGFQQPQNAQLQPQTYDPSTHQESQQSMEGKIEQGQEVVGSGEQDANEPVDWAQMSEQPLDEWNKTDGHDASGQMSQQQSQQSQQAWGEQRGGYRGRGGRRGNSNGYNSRGRGGSYQQNGRGGAGQGTYYRNDNSNYQNGYQQRSYNNEGSAGYNGGFKRGGGGGGGERGGSRGGPRGERGGMDSRGGRGGQFRGGQRGGNRGGGHVPRGKPQAQQ